jgi:hypothetical protein
MISPYRRRTASACASASSGLTSTAKQSLLPYGHASGSVVLWCCVLPAAIAKYSAVL